MRRPVLVKGAEDCLAMIVLEDLPEPPHQVFMLATPAHMLTKLHWEIYSLRKALSEKPEHIGHTHAPAYCAFNCAVTAWHLADWVWNASSEDRRADILALLGSTAGNDRNAFGKFQTAIRSKSGRSTSADNWPLARSI
jgi:hypothetical protein